MVGLDLDGIHLLINGIIVSGLADIAILGKIRNFYFLKIGKTMTISMRLATI